MNMSLFVYTFSSVPKQYLSRRKRYECAPDVAKTQKLLTICTIALDEVVTHGTREVKCYLLYNLNEVFLF